MIRLVAATKLYGQLNADGAAVPALNGVDLEIPSGEFLAIMGPSGCGKSTLLHVLGGLDRLSSGEFFLEGAAVHLLDEAGLTRLRAQKIGFVFQFFNLLPTLTLEENVQLPALLQHRPEKEMRTRCAELLARVGIAHRAHHRLHQLSGGEMQRAALARALILSPALVLADEPTGNLDSEASEKVMALFRDLGTRYHTTIIMVTHSREIAEFAHRRISMRDGKVVTAPESSSAPPA